MYRVLYRKWRPQVFDDVIGQPHVTKTLVSQLKENRLSHAYLFSGSRGTGKTTCAKIFSKAVNCLNPVNGNPCNECEMCRMIDSGAAVDIVEMDAASNRGIDDIRTLRDEASFTPTRAKYRVYIIDEVHMLTTEAANALLKTLEEPPQHVLFIMATTEPQKLLPTILSRCQRFDFKRIEPREIADRLLKIADAEGVTLTDDAALLIARIADGGMRDALSLLDSAISVSENVTADVVVKSAGLTGKDRIYSLMRAVSEKNIAECLTILDSLHNDSCDTERLINEMISQFRNYLLVKTVDDPSALIVSTADELKTIKDIAGGFTSEQILYSLRILSDTAAAVKRTLNRRVEAEMALVRLCSPEADTDVDALCARISALEKELAEIKQNGIAVKNTVPEPVQVTKSELQKTVDNTPAVDETPPFDDASPFDDAPPFDDTPPFDAPAADTAPEFEGFAADSPSSSFADKFAAEDDDDDEPFDFDSFMQEYGHENSDDIEDNTENGDRKADVLAPSSEPGEKPGRIDNREWVRIILAAEQNFKPLIGQFTNSSGYILGETVFVCPANKNIKKFVPESVLDRYFAPAVRSVLGKDYKVKYENE